MPRFAKARDANEPAIVEALRAAGWSVERIDPVGRNNGTPDLLLGRSGYTTLAEVKRPAGPKGGRKDKRLTDVQEAWHEAWRGARPMLLDQEPAACVALCEEWLAFERYCLASNCR